MKKDADKRTVRQSVLCLIWAQIVTRANNRATYTLYHSKPFFVSVVAAGITADLTVSTNIIARNIHIGSITLMRKAKMSQCKIDQKSLKLQIRQHEWAGVQKVREPINSKKNMC